MKKGLISVLVFVMAAVMVMGCAHTNGTEGSTEGSGIVRGEVAILKAQVVAVDLDKRIVTLKDAAGDVRDFKVGKDAVNLPQVKAGDIVTIKFLESVAVEVIKPGMPAGAGGATTIVRAKPGEMPGGMITRQSSITAVVKALDKEAGTVSLMGPNGKTVKVKVQERENLEKVKLGDELLITFTEAEAISVSRPE
ncbi:hypothetical protein SAMN04489760_10763 [Syntrophus gentianae]|uniref:Copper binding protein CusF n=1 Tax=Syntrophus gentianae TaxID=43775 RepID=A0A1H7WP67_9BACT|nr:hypothetical protein [Syntrophus gentianae]SEM22955.1 hypothetical protein SAMN04489760_10763 [Syntrophus gentianae]